MSTKRARTTSQTKHSTTNFKCSKQQKKHLPRGKCFFCCLLHYLYLIAFYLRFVVCLFFCRCRVLLFQDACELLIQFGCR